MKMRPSIAMMWDCKIRINLGGIFGRS